MEIKRVELLRFTPKELTVQPCDLSRQLLDAALQFFILLSLFLLVADNEAIEAFSPSIVLSNIAFSSIACLFFTDVKILIINGLYNNTSTFFNKKHVIHGTPYALP